MQLSILSPSLSRFQVVFLFPVPSMIDLHSSFDTDWPRVANETLFGFNMVDDSAVVTDGSLVQGLAACVASTFRYMPFVSTISPSLIPCQHAPHHIRPPAHVHQAGTLACRHRRWSTSRRPRPRIHTSARAARPLLSNRRTTS